MIYCDKSETFIIDTLTEVEILKGKIMSKRAEHRIAVTKGLKPRFPQHDNHRHIYKTYYAQGEPVMSCICGRLMEEE